MRRFLAIGMFAAAIVAFFVLGRVEAGHRSAVIDEGLKSVNTQLDKERAGAPATPAARTEFLEKQQRILGAVKNQQSAAVTPNTTPSSNESAPSAPAIDAYMPVILTVILGIGSFWMILSKGFKTDDEVRKWAFGTLGIILGYWFKGAG
jgi:hypothetical protein